MRRLSKHLSLLLFIAAFAGIVAPGHARYEVEVIDTFPSGSDINLGLDDRYSVQIRYRTDEPIRIWARPFYEGQRVQIMTNASELHSGEGEALGWFSSANPVEVDEVRIFVGERGGDSEEAASYPVKIHIGGGASPLQSEPTWVTSLIDETNQAQIDSLAEDKNNFNGSDAALIFGLMAAVFGLTIGGIVLPIVAFRKWQGGWKVAAAVPMCIMGFAILQIIVGVILDPTSHNLWPFELIFIGAISLAMIVILKIARFFIGRRADA